MPDFELVNKICIKLPFKYYRNERCFRMSSSIFYCSIIFNTLIIDIGIRNTVYQKIAATERY